MGLSRRERRLLAAIGDGVSSADPGLAGLLARFNQLAAREAVPGHERLGSRAGRAWPSLSAVACAIARLAPLPLPMPLLTDAAVQPGWAAAARPRGPAPRATSRRRTS
jgi:hypothetical protein